MEALFEVVALYDFDASMDNQLSLRMGDRLAVLRQEENGWWHGVNLEGNSGWFPATFVEQTLAVPGKQFSNRNSLDFDADVGIDENTQGIPTAHPDWLMYSTDEGDRYYVNHMTGESSWELPSVNLSPSTPPLILGTPPILSDDDTPPSTNNTSLRNSPAEMFSVSPSKAGTSSSMSIKSFQSSTIKAPNFQDPNAKPLMEDGRYGYKNNFWSDKGDKSGFDTLVLKHRNGKEVCKDIAQFMSERMKIEEQYAKALLELSKSSLGEMESGTSKTAWNQIKFDVKNQAKSRLEFADSLSKDIQKAFMDFKDSQKKTRKDFEATIALDRKSMMEKFRKVQKMHTLYMNKARDAEVADALVSRGPLDTMSKRDFQKIEDNARKERKKASMAAFDYKNAIKDYETVRNQWEDDMIGACSEFQQAEEDRIDFIRNTLIKYMDIQKKVNNECKSSSEMAENSVEAICKEVDIEMFVKEKFTGSERPIELVFEGYKGYE